MIWAHHVAREIAANTLMSFQFFRNWRIRRGRTTHEDPGGHAKLILDQFSFFMDTINPEHIKGKTVAEIGPGDAIPHGLLFLGAGAKQYVAIDRFLGNVAGRRSRQIYSCLAETAPDYIK